MKRNEAEINLEFIGFIIFENKLKPSTTGVLDELAQAGIRKVMCTGDNILTAISVARECNLIDRNAHCFVPHFASGMSATQYANDLLILVQGNSRDPTATLAWESIDNHIYELDARTLKVGSSRTSCIVILTCISHSLHLPKEMPPYPMIFLTFETIR